MKMFYEKDTDVNLIKEKKIAIFGYGSQGHAHAANMRDSGVKNVRIALREDSSSVSKAKDAGYEVMNVVDAAKWADIMMMATPDELQSQIWEESLKDNMKTGSALGFDRQILSYLSIESMQSISPENSPELNATNS